MPNEQTAATSASADPAPVKARRLPPQQARFQLTAQANTSFTVVAEVGTTLEDVLVPGYWAHFAQKLIPGDEIIVFVDDWSWEARLRVRSKGPLGAVVAVLSENHYDANPMKGDLAGLASQFTIEWKGPAWQWCVFRIGETEPVAKLYKSQEEASRWLAENTKSLQKKAA